MRYLRSWLIGLVLIFIQGINLSACEQPTEESVTRLYVATFNRAPDKAGLDYWLYRSFRGHPCLENIAQSFFDQPETKERYPNRLQTRDFVKAIYRNLFNRDPDPDGWDYWTQEIEKYEESGGSEGIPRDRMILAVINGAIAPTGNPTDAQVLTNKTKVGLSFVNAGLNDTEQAKAVMAGVTSNPATVQEAQKKIDHYREPGRCLAQMGRLANARVSIYKVNSNGRMEKIYTETTTPAAELEGIGYFRMPKDLEMSAYYVIQVSGGENWDVDNDGMIDPKPTPNRGVIRSIAKGFDIYQAMQDEYFRMTTISEVFYEKVAPILKYKGIQPNFDTLLDSMAKQIFDRSVIDPDREVSRIDVYRFDPVNDQKFLSRRYRASLDKTIETISNGMSIYGAFGGTYAGWSADANLSWGNNEGEDIAISKDGNTVYIANGYNGLSIIDVGNNKGWKEVDHFDKWMDKVVYFRTATANNLVVLASDGEKNQIVKLSKRDGDTHYAIDYTRESSEAQDIACDGQYIYIAKSNGLEIRSVWNFEKVSSIDTGTSNVKITVSGGYVYFSGIDKSWEQEITSVNVSKPDNPKIAGQISLPGSANELLVKSGKLYVAIAGVGVGVYDLSDPSTMPEISRMKLTGRVDHLAVSRDGKQLYVSGFYGGIRFIDINDPASPKLVEKVFIPVGFPQAMAMDKDNRTLYVAPHEGLLLAIDRLDHKNPGSLGSLDNIAGGKDLDLSKDGKTIYIIGSGDNNPKVVSVDVSDPFHPGVLSESSNAAAHGLLSQSGNYLYLNDGGIYKIEFRSTLTQTGMVEGIAGWNDASAIGTTVYLATSNGIKVLEAGDPYNPYLATVYNDTEYVRSIDAKNGIVYAGANSKLILLNANWNQNCTYLSDIKLEGNYGSVTVSSIVVDPKDQRTLVLSYSNGAYLFDISSVSCGNPPILLKRIKEVSGTAMELGSDGHTVYLSAGEGAILMSDLNESDPQIRPVMFGGGDIAAFKLSSDDSLLYSTGYDQALKIFDISLFRALP
ncbi:DUF4214 domain-containing protein [Thermococcus sp.]|uniref:DUF4214 domain-containing protein n=1 Tax=Thermococcus sp. TaxID=35749 RepID=UPI0026337250|nr:DUF4214 domain-containing protein [Thermococcus sp.]